MSFQQKKDILYKIRTCKLRDKLDGSVESAIKTYIKDVKISKLMEKMKLNDIE